MAKTTGKINEIFDQQAITKQIEGVKGGLESTLKLLEQVAVAGKNVSVGMGKAKDINEQTAAQKALNKAQAEGERLSAELIEAEKQQAVANERNRQALAAKKRELRENVQLEKAAKDSISATTKLVRDLTSAYNQMSSAERKSAAGQELKKHIADTNKLLRDQKMELNDTSKNVGNYGSVWDRAKGSVVKFMAAYAALAIAGRSVISFMKSSIEEAGKAEQAEKKLTTALGYRSKALIQQANELQKVTAFEDDNTVEAMSRLAMMKIEESQIKKLIPLIQDFAAAKGMDLVQAADLVSKAVGSSTNALGRYGIQIEGAAGSTERCESAVQALTTRFQGQAEAMGSTGLGAIEKWKNAWGNFKETIGANVLPFLGAIASKLADIINRRNELAGGDKGGGYSDVAGFMDTYKGADTGDQKKMKVATDAQAAYYLLKWKQAREAGNENARKTYAEMYDIAKEKLDKIAALGTVKDRELTDEEKAKLQKQLEEQKKNLQEVLKMRIEMGKASITEMWNAEKAAIQDQEAYKLLSEDEKNEYLLMKWREFLSKQFTITKEQADNINAMMRSAADSGFKGTTPGVLSTPTTKKDPNAGITEDIDMSNAEGPTFGTQDQIDKTGVELQAGKVNSWLKRQVELYGETYGQMTEIVDGFFANELARIDQKSAKDEAARERELEAAGGNSAKIDAINAKYDKKKKEREKEALKLKQKQAKFDMAVGIMNAIVNTAVGITGMIANPGGVLGVVLAALAAATGLAQIAVLASTPIPTYAKGRKGGKAEYAVVGEKGAEAVITKEGEAYLTPGEPTFTYLPEGATVIPNHELYDAAGVAALTTRLPAYESSYSISLEELRGDVRGLYAGFIMLAGVVRDKRENHLNITAAGMSKLSRHGADWERYLNDEIRF